MLTKAKINKIAIGRKICDGTEAQEHKNKDADIVIKNDLFLGLIDGNKLGNFRLDNRHNA